MQCSHFVLLCVANKSELLLVLSKFYMVMVPTLPILTKSGVSPFYFHFKLSQNSQNQKIFCSTHPRLLYAAYLFFIMTLMAFLNDPMFNLRIPILRKPSKKHLVDCGLFYATVPTLISVTTETFHTDSVFSFSGFGYSATVANFWYSIPSGFPKNLTSAISIA